VKGIRINFDEQGPRFDLEEPVSGFDATVQNALVNTGTDRGSDRLFEDRGTDLKRDSADGKMATLAWANHTSNFAALRTLAFLQQHDQATNAWKLQAFELRCLEMDLTTVILNVTAVSDTGLVVGGLANI
jgi:hypothetical protein